MKAARVQPANPAVPGRSARKERRSNTDSSFQNNVSSSRRDSPSSVDLTIFPSKLWFVCFGFLFCFGLFCFLILA